ncbi:MAG: hypothetical protein EBR23_09040 [Planctomycetia bacterium]|nr:hypothetical protein [Planctomycetia bacterium]
MVIGTVPGPRKGGAVFAPGKANIAPAAVKKINDALAATGASGKAGEIVSWTLWRDVLHRPAADGRDAWRLRRDEFFVLGDFPSGSIDGRQWGPLHRAALRHRVGPP